MKHTRVVSTKCTPGFACRAFSDTTLVCFIVNEHTTKCSHYNIKSWGCDKDHLEMYHIHEIRIELQEIRDIPPELIIHLGICNTSTASSKYIRYGSRCGITVASFFSFSFKDILDFPENCYVLWIVFITDVMMTSPNGNIFRITGHLRGEFIGHRWISVTRPVTRSFDVFFGLRLNKRVNNREAGDLRCHCAHYDVTVIVSLQVNCDGTCEIWMW